MTVGPTLLNWIIYPEVTKNVYFLFVQLTDGECIEPDRL